MFGHSAERAIRGFEEFVAAGMIVPDGSAPDGGAWPLDMAVVD
jgi:hypothetical protein